MRFKDKVVLVTGAGSGIGKATAIGFGNEGAVVVVCDVILKKAEETADEINAGGKGLAKAYYIDISDSACVKQVMGDVLSMYGKIDVLANVAGIIFLGKIEDVSDEAWDRVLDVNLKGTFLCCREITPVLKKQGFGCIVNVTAGAAKTGGMNVGANYVASKAGISVLTIHLAKQLAPWRIRVNAVSPGPIDTPMLAGDSGGGDYTEEKKANIANATPLGMGYPEDVANGILFLADEEHARYITGEILDVDGGLFMD